MRDSHNIYYGTSRCAREPGQSLNAGRQTHTVRRKSSLGTGKRKCAIRIIYIMEPQKPCAHGPWAGGPARFVAGSAAQQIRQRQCDDLGRLVQVRERQALIGAVGIGFLDRVRAGAVEDDRNAGLRVVARVGIERHA